MSVKSAAFLGSGVDLAHHLSTLVQGELVIQERRGREIISRADYAATTVLLSFLTDECCVGVTLIEGAAA